MPKARVPHRKENGTALKRCTKCTTWKALRGFSKQKAKWDKLNPWCKGCCALYYEENKESIAAKQRSYKRKNAEKISSYLRKYNEQNKEKIKQLRKESRKENPTYRLTGNMRNALRQSLKKAKLKKNNRTFKYISCSPSFLLERLEKMRIERGLGEDYHIDHMMPIDSFDLTNAEELRCCWNWSNLQALSPKENREKSNKVIYDMKWTGEEWVIRTKKGNGLYRPTALFRSVLFV
jgi:hypothetical protein